MKFKVKEVESRWEFWAKLWKKIERHVKELKKKEEIGKNLW